MRKLLYRHGGLSHTLGHSLSHGFSHMTYGSPAPGPIVAPAREGHRRKFSETDKRRIVEEAVRPGASLSEVARRYGIAARILFRWKQELTPVAAPVFVTVEIAHMDASPDRALGDEEHVSYAASSRHEGAPGVRLYRYAQGHRRARHAGPEPAAAGPPSRATCSCSGVARLTSSRSCTEMAPAFASSPSGLSRASSCGLRTWSRVGHWP